MFKLLIVDDEPLVCVGVQSMLDWAALDVEIAGVARNGQHAAKMIEEHHPDIIISDIKMPIKNGLRLAQECNEKYGRLPVFIMLTSYEEFIYARQALKAQAVDYLIKPELDADTLKNAIHKALDIVRKHKADMSNTQVLVHNNIQALREKFFVRLYNNLFEDEEMYQIQKKELEIDLSAAGFTVASCRMLVPGGREVNTRDQITMYSSAMQLVRETLPKYLRCFVIPLAIWHFTIIFCLDETMNGAYKASVREALEQTSALIHSYLNISLHAAVGSVVNDPRNLSLSYSQSQLCAHDMQDADMIVFCEPAVDISGNNIIEMQAMRHKIHKAFEEMDTIALDEALSAMANVFEKYPNDLLQAMDTTCNILYMAISLLPEGEKLVEEIFSGFPDGYRMLYHLRDIRSIAAWICQLRDGCNELLQSRKHSYKEHVVANVKTYIRENLNKRLSLQEVAAVFNFNPNYLSQLFSKYADVGFVEYITGVRISAAKEFLAQGELRIYEIAERLGYESSFYFSKVFKKYEGVSPKEYLDKLNQSFGEGSKSQPK
jgi:two-component system response regulator YesN